MDSREGIVVTDADDSELNEQLLVQLRDLGLAQFRVVNGWSSREHDIPHEAVVRWKHENRSRSLASAVMEMLRDEGVRVEPHVILSVGMDLASIILFARFIADERRRGASVCFIIRAADKAMIWNELE